ncbi:unnamed protein product [Mytilus coruscus]|uniref:Uncharacterized protein n=1 Tax=Mytilus coruscus TaxID=42192 RepID=A0A6J8CFQ0_MYTCO|nr:unnamed protein product [Mytilus coruscus]
MTLPISKFQYKYHCKQTFFLLSLNLCPIQPLYDNGAETRMNLKLRSIRAGRRSAVSRLIKKFEDIQQEENGTVDTEDVSNILDGLKRKQELLRKLDEEIVQELDDGDIETEIVEADEYAFNLEVKIRQVNKLYLSKNYIVKYTYRKIYSTLRNYTTR